MKTVLLLLGANCFMTVAWYGHLKFKTAPLLLVILVAWLIALPEYCLQVPANRLGQGEFTTPQLKILAEGLGLLTFLVFSIAVLKEVPRWQDGVAMLLIIGGMCVSLLTRVPAAGAGIASESPPASKEQRAAGGE